MRKRKIIESEDKIFFKDLNAFMKASSADFEKVLKYAASQMGDKYPNGFTKAALKACLELQKAVKAKNYSKVEDLFTSGLIPDDYSDYIFVQSSKLYDQLLDFSMNESIKYNSERSLKLAGLIKESAFEENDRVITKRELKQIGYKQPVPAGTKGTVETVHEGSFWTVTYTIKWDNGMTTDVVNGHLLLNKI